VTTYKAKAENVEKIFSNIRTIEMPTSTSHHVVGKIDSLLNLNECDFCKENLCQFVAKSEISDADEIIVLVDPNDFSSSVEFDIAASCVFKIYRDQNKVKQISLVDKTSSPNTFKRLANFKINYCLSQFEEECEYFNYVDCTWLDPSIQQDIFDATNCDKLKR
jgi:hypothetical protein